MLENAEVGWDVLFNSSRGIAHPTRAVGMDSDRA